MKREPAAPVISEQANLAQSVVGGSVTVLSGQIAIKVASVVFNILVIRYLGSEEYGKFAVCAAFGGLFAVLSDLGLAPLAVRRVARDHSLIPETFSNFVAIRLLLSVGVIAITSALAWLLGYAGDIRLGIFIAGLGLLSYAVFGLVDSVALGLERFRTSATLNVVNQVVVMLLAGALVFNGAGFLGLLVAATVGPLCVAAVAARRMNRGVSLRSPLQPRLWPAVMRSALPFAAISLALAVSYKADLVILSGFVSVSTIGLYAVAYNLVFTVVSVSHSINLALFPVMTRQHARSPEAAHELFQKGVQYLLFISLPFAVFMSVNADQMVTFLYGDGFAGAATALAIVCWVIPLMFLAEYLGYVAIVLDREKMAARANWVSSGSNVAGNLMLVPFLGIIAAAAITVVTELLLLVQYVLALRSRIVFTNTLGPVIRVVCSAMLLGLSTAALGQIDLPFLAVAAASVAAYFLFGALTGALGRSELHVIQSLLAARVGVFRRRHTDIVSQRLEQERR